MKRFTALILLVVLAFSLFACGEEQKAEKYCWNCGEGVTKDASFCEHCGTKLNETQNENTSTSESSESTLNTNEDSDADGSQQTEYSDEQSAEFDSSKTFFYSTNDYETAKKGNSGVFSYKNKSGSYDVYWIIDFEEGYVYFFTDGNGDDTCDKVGIVSGDLNDKVTATWYDGEDQWSWHLHFKYENQPEILIVNDHLGIATEFTTTDLVDALRLRETKNIYTHEETIDPNPPSTQSPDDTYNEAISEAEDYVATHDCATPNAIREHLKSKGYTDDQIEHAISEAYINWYALIKNVIWSYNFEAEEIIVTTCYGCDRRFFGEYSSCPDLACSGYVFSSSYYGYSRVDTIKKLSNAGFLQEDIDAAMKNYEYGEFIDEQDFSDCIVVTGILCEHFWNPATCQELSSCPYCGETKGDYASHEYSEHKCIVCGSEEPWTAPQISCSSWVSLKELEEKAGYYITTPGNSITIEDLNDNRVNFVLEGFPNAWSGGYQYCQLSYNGVTVQCEIGPISNHVYQSIKLKYTDLVAIGVLS